MEEIKITTTSTETTSTESAASAMTPEELKQKQSADMKEFWNKPGFREKVRRGQLLKQVATNEAKLQDLTFLAGTNAVAESMAQSLKATINYQRRQIKECEDVLTALGEMPKPKPAKQFATTEAPPVNV